MKDNLKVTKKQIKGLANQLNAITLSDVSIYYYENALAKLLYSYYEEKINVYCDIIAYSVGKYGNSGRIDHIYNEDGSISQFVCWY